MRRCALGIILLACLGGSAVATLATASDAEPVTRKLVEIYRIAPGKHEAFLRAIARCDEVNHRAGLPPRQLYVHQDGASWDFMLIQDAAYPEGAGEAVGQAWDDLRLPSGPRFFTEFRSFILEHTDTFVSGPTSASAYLALLDATPPSAGFDGMATPRYRLSGTVVLDGPPRWDYLQVEPTSRRLFLAHDTVIEVLDLDSHIIVGQVRGLAGAHGIALAPAFDVGFVANSDRDTVSAFRLSSLEVIGEAPVGSEPDSVTYEPVTGRIAVWNGGSNDLSVLDARTLETVATLPLTATPEFAVADGRGAVFANLEDSHRVVRVDMEAPEVATSLDLDGCIEPHGLAIDTQARRLFAGCANDVLVVVDADTGRTVGRARIGRDSDAVVFDPLRSRVYASSSEGFVSVVDLDATGAPTRTTDVQTRVTGRTMAVDPVDGTLFVPAADLELDWTTRQAVFVEGGLKLYVYQPMAP